MSATQPRLILASASPRRLDILRAHGHDPVVIKPDVNEQLDAQTALPDLPALLEELALSKARYVLGYLFNGELMDAGQVAADAAAITIATDQPLIIIAADTVVYTDQIIGKPRDHAAAVQTLLELRNRTHTVLTAVAVIELPDAKEQSFTDQALVRFGDYNLETIENYISTEPPYDKAGSYAIQGIWSHQVTSIIGDRNTVIGLPYQRLADLLGW